MRTLALVLSIAVSVALPGVSSAGALDACGAVTLPLTAHCQVEPPGISCQTRCTPLNMQLSCARQLFTECSPQCTVQVVPTEVQVCVDTCAPQCTVNPGSFDCSADCGAKCTADCSTTCATASDTAGCTASCQASCTGYCEADCKAVLPTMTCQEKCQQSCHGIHTARVNMDCQLQCHTVERYTNCEVKLTGGCQTQCQASQGALFCDGQYINVSSNLQQCIQSLKDGSFIVELLQVTGLESCGAVVKGLSTCKIEPPGITCDAKCTPLSARTTCAKQLFTECSPQCTVQVVPTEVQVCADSCVPQCNVNPGSFNCSATCGGKCTADCSAACSGSADADQCKASCEASCSGYCEADCKAVFPSMTCKEKCQRSCHAVQVAKLNMDCQLKCHTVERYTSCKTKITGGCKAQCQTTTGALFCNEQYINTTTLQQCLDALNNLAVIIDDWRKKIAEAGGCAATVPSPRRAGVAILLLLLPLGVLLRRRRAG
jgi:hypothetical protein